ncbi:PLP-dependent aspartate aminotransferase family protein [Flavobacteriaceae bacterium]|nr:PLP-dependent aspartate aminotransferase family protein [Flavobacteriaceae bacterium]MDB2456323.1 PLP-dependent aspartate aminotransferase family protein [Flavobacteriaceae bacterium]
MKKNKLETLCVHEGQLKDLENKGAISPLYMATAYAYDEVEVTRYPRYFNTPNQVGLAKKIAALEGAEQGIIFGSGMAAISTALLSHLRSGDHIVLQADLYGGTTNLIVEEFEKFGIEYSFSPGLLASDLEKLIQPNTKVVFIETPSNPLMKLVNLEAVAKMAKKKGIISIIDNTFASPINQNPISFGIDVVIHSATKYLGGHSDILAGAVVGSQKHIEVVFQMAKNLGGSLSDYTVWLLERSMKTLSIRVKAQNENAVELAKFLENSKSVDQVYYPGLKSHPDHELACLQMNGFGGMLSFELSRSHDLDLFQKNLHLIKPAVSLAGVESTITIPTKTSHALISSEERKAQGIKDNLIRFSVGIEHFDDLKEDIDQALIKSKL